MVQMQTECITRGVGRGYSRDCDARQLYTLAAHPWPLFTDQGPSDLYGEGVRKSLGNKHDPTHLCAVNLLFERQVKEPC